ncbi:hypothetical protein BFAG_02110 [Bacteroides fragilis 3_1_12]|uniref:Uncharacterized protein n=1 Tax=Bacteroides fragilis 3_1_12 TaxID=457424 RepID=A0ABN0BKQ6_BACFG|nr:hypothetical protein BFAG_02110 [Bacteroides fragilis 3_1_12]
MASLMKKASRPSFFKGDREFFYKHSFPVNQKILLTLRVTFENIKNLMI